MNSIYKKHLHHAKKTHILNKLNDNKNKTRNLYNILRSLTKLKEENAMPPTESSSDVPKKFADFFLNKIQKIREQFHGQSTKSHITGNAQNSVVSCLWKKMRYSTLSKI